MQTTKNTRTSYQANSKLKKANKVILTWMLIKEIKLWQLNLS